jgi:hypothetical protein
MQPGGTVRADFEIVEGGGAGQDLYKVSAWKPLDENSRQGRRWIAGVASVRHRLVIPNINSCGKRTASEVRVEISDSRIGAGAGHRHVFQREDPEEELAA